MAAENDDRTKRLNDPETGAEHSETEAVQGTRRIGREAASEAEFDGEPDEPAKKGLFENLRKAYMRARDGRNPKSKDASQDRNAKSNDRSKGLVIIGIAAVFMLFVFIAMFSHSSGSRGGHRSCTTVATHATGYRHAALRRRWSAKSRT